MGNRYRHITGSKSISGDYQNINETFDMIEDDVVALEKNHQSTTQSVNSLQTQINELVVNGDSSPAAAQAAIDANGHDYKNLKLRLDTEHTELAAQLADKAPQSALDITNLVVATKAPQSELDEANAQISLRPTYDEVNELLNGLGDISPKGAFPTLAALEAAYPNGAEGLYLVAADNYWYYWNGSVWTRGAVYQAMPWASFMTTQNQRWEV